LQLRLGGAPYRDIATALEVSLKTAYYDVQDALGQLDFAVKAKAERLRDLEAARLDRWLLGLSAGLEHGERRLTGWRRPSPDRRAGWLLERVRRQ
jgi:hypothetical protein